MRSASRAWQKISLAGIAGVLLAASAMAAEPPVGMVIVAQNARVDSADASMGANVYIGDHLDTTDGGALRLRIGAGQLFIMSKSNATLAKDANQVNARLYSGSAGFSATSADPLEIETPVGMLRPADKSRAYGQVTITGVNRVLITSYEGTLLLTRNGVERTIEAGKSYSVSVPLASGGGAAASASAQTPQGSGTNGGGNWVFDGSVIAGSALAAWGLWTIYCESQSTTSSSSGG